MPMAAVNPMSILLVWYLGIGERTTFRRNTTEAIGRVIHTQLSAVTCIEITRRWTTFIYTLV
jgi:hypothetical protein